MKWLSGNIKKINIYSDTLYFTKNDGVINLSFTYAFKNNT